MIDPVVLVAGIAVAGAMPSVAIVALRNRDARRWSSKLVAYRLEVPSAFDPAALQPFLSTLTGLLPSRWERPVSVRGIGIEIFASGDGIVHNLLVPQHQSDIVLGQAQASLPGVRMTLLPEYRPPTPTLAAELGTARPSQQLRIDRPEVVSAGILAALQPLGADERMIVQLLLFPVITRSSNHPPVVEAVVSTMSDVLFPKNRSGSSRKAPEVTDKQRLPQFIATLRLGVRSGSPARDRQLLARLVASYHGANSVEAHLRRRQLPNRQIRRALVRRRPPALAYPCMLNTAELAGLAALPPKGISLPGLRTSGSRLLAPSSDIPTTGLIIGDSNFPGMSRPVALSLKGSLQHVLITGPPGVGKSWLLANVIVQAMEAGYGVIVIDPKSDLITDVADRVPVQRQADCTIIDPLDDRVVGINLLQSDDPDLAAEQLYAVIHRLNKDSWGPRLGDLLRAALHTLARTENATLIDLVPLLTDINYRQRVIGSLDDPLGLGGLWAWFDSLSETERLQAIAPILNKVRPWVVRPRLRHILGQAEPLLDMDEALADGRILLVPLSSGELGADAAQLLGAVVMAKVTQSVMRRVRLPQPERRPVLLVVDEAQMLGTLPTPIPELMAVSRAMSVGILAAHQHLGQFDAELRDSLLGTARSRVTFQTSAVDANRFARDLAPHLGAEDLQNLPAFEAVATVATGGRVAPPTTVRTRPLPPGNGQSAVVREISRLRWGRDRAEVEAELRGRQERPTGGGSVGRQRRSE